MQVYSDSEISKSINKTEMEASLTDGSASSNYKREIIQLLTFLWHMHDDKMWQIIYTVIHTLYRRKLENGNASF